jgi:hypothetical protein
MDANGQALVPTRSLEQTRDVMIESQGFSAMDAGARTRENPRLLSE